MSEPKFMADLMDSWQRGMEERERKHQERLANDPVFAQAERERAERVAAREREEAVMAEKRESAERKLRLVQRGIPAKDVDALLAGGLRDTSALGISRGWWESESSVLVLSGTRGCGKTTAAAWVVAQDPKPSPLHELYMEGVLRGRPDMGKRKNPMFLDVTKLQRASRYDEERMAEIEYASTLAIDDLGLEYADAKGSFTALFDGLFNTRYAEQLKTVITTNLTATDFKARYGERVADRIRECGRFVELSDPSMRGR